MNKNKLKSDCCGAEVKDDCGNDNKLEPQIVRVLKGGVIFWKVCSNCGKPCNSIQPEQKNKEWGEALKKFQELCGEIDVHILNIITTDENKTIVATLAEGVFKPLIDKVENQVRIETAKEKDELIMELWGIVANVDWDIQSKEWREAAIRFRTKYFGTIMGS